MSRLIPSIASLTVFTIATGCGASSTDASLPVAVSTASATPTGASSGPEDAPVSHVEHGTSDTPVPTPSVSPTSTPHASGPPRAGWPLPDDCSSPERCKTSAGELGVQCTEKSACVNPCPAGMAPSDTGMFCEHVCKTDADCYGATCTEEMLCEGFPVFPCKNVLDCKLPDGHEGARCTKTDPCVNPCKPGTFQSPNGDCAKPCKSAADCPGGTCDAGFCGPTCPSTACPYPWD